MDVFTSSNWANTKSRARMGGGNSAKTSQFYQITTEKILLICSLRYFRIHPHISVIGFARLLICQCWSVLVCLSTTRIKKKDALLNGSFSHKGSEKLIKILDHFKALRKYFHMAPISHCYLFLFRNGISLSENIAYFSFAIHM